MKKIKLSGGLVSLIDDVDYERISRFIWSASRRRDQFEAVAMMQGKRVKMHRYILDAKAGEEVDHINQNPLDNRRLNIRIADRSTQTSNRAGWAKSGKKGVYRIRNGNWASAIWVGGKLKHLGTRNSKKGAEELYLKNATVESLRGAQHRRAKHTFTKVKSRRKYDLSKYSNERYITYRVKKNIWVVQICRAKIFKEFKTKEEAIKWRDEHWKKQ